jgi:hypothetical protein
MKSDGRLDRLREVLEWLYTQDGAFDTKNEWRDELVNRLYWLVEVPRNDEEDEL